MKYGDAAGARYAAVSGAALHRFTRRFTREAHLRTILPHLLDEPEG